jgi:hypothetical protein
MAGDDTQGFSFNDNAQGAAGAIGYALHVKSYVKAGLGDLSR